MSKRGRESDTPLTQYEKERSSYMRENHDKLRALNLESIFESCGLRKGKATTNRNPRHKVSKTTQPDLGIGCDSLRPRAASTRAQDDDLLDGQIEKRNDHVDRINEDRIEAETENGRGRKFTRKENIWSRANENLPLIKLEFNEFGQPIGQAAKEFPGVVSTLIRTKEFPLDYEDWRDVPDDKKYKLIEDLECVYEMDEPLVDYTYVTAAKKWKDFKADLKKAKFDETKTDEELLARRDKRIDAEQWKWLIKHWRSQKAQDRSTRGKTNRSKLVTTHTAGSKSFARVRHEWSKELGYQPRRDELYMKTHTHKDGVPLQQSQAQINALREAATRHPELLEKSIKQGDLFSTVFGRDPRGHVRTVSLGPTPSSLGMLGHRKYASTKVQMAVRGRRKSEEEVTLLRGAMAELFEEVQDLKRIVRAGKGMVEDTPECGSNPTMDRSTHTPQQMIVSDEDSEHEYEEFCNDSDDQVIHRRRAPAQLRRNGVSGKEVILLSMEEPYDHVAKATVQTTDPRARVGGSLLGNECYEVVVNTVMKSNYELPRQYGKLKILGDTFGKSVAWPHLKIIDAGRAAKQSHLQEAAESTLPC